MIKPTIGRVMWFWPVASERGAQPYASMVTYVHDDNTVNLAVFNTDGALFPASSVSIVQDGSPYVAGDLPYAEWMPYQIGQAQKHEAYAGSKVPPPNAVTKNDPTSPVPTPEEPPSRNLPDDIQF